MGLQKFPLRRSETVEVKIDNVSNSQYRFSDNETTLQNVKLYGIQVHSQSLSKSFQGNTVLADAIQKKAYLTLTDRNQQAIIKRIPLETFFNDQKFMLELDGLDIDVRKSFIELQDKAGVNVNDCFVLTFFFEPAK
jgi:hypothetical protein